MSKLSGLINFLFGKDGRVIATQGDSLPQPEPRPQDQQPGKHLTAEPVNVTAVRDLKAAQAMVRRSLEISSSASPFVTGDLVPKDRRYGQQPSSAFTKIAAGLADAQAGRGRIANREPKLVDPTDMSAITASM